MIKFESKYISVYNENSLWTIIVEPVTEIVRPADGLKKAEKTELKQKNVASVEKSVNAAVEKNAAPLDNGKMKQSEKAVITQKVTEPDAAPQPDGAKRSFADIVSFYCCKFFFNIGHLCIYL